MSANEISSKKLVIGLPETGKTTFLAALWHVVYEEDVPGSLRLKELPDLNEHLNKIAQKWINCQPLERTAIGSEKMVSMKLLETESDIEAQVFFPDMSGESFLNHLKDRQWEKEYDDLVREANGILLFINPEKLIEPIRIDQKEPLIQEISNSQEEESGSTGSSDALPWDIEKVPTQVQLVELLQFYMNKPYSYRIPRIAVIISAWDLVQKHRGSPDLWLRKRLPLLSQYLRANKETFSYKVYGVSAQGGDLKKDGERLHKIVKPTERIMVVGDKCNPHDITAPVKWLMGTIR